MIVLYFHLKSQFKYELFHILHIIINFIIINTNEIPGELSLVAMAS